mmetsp:Transcript_12098/g.17201  ORF Transcript_12098/g.17201 Transcript_12098/m.17201 type:complete len:939 (+) Transcript_12098:26-2842(+)
MGRRWSRKRKAGDKKHKANNNNNNNKNNNNNHKRIDYTPIFQGNPRMEAYYAYQGLHNVMLDQDTQTFRSCRTDAEREIERKTWLSNLRKVLPASFRIGTDVESGLREKLEHELEEFVGTEMEIMIDPEDGKGGYINPEDEEEQQGGEEEKKKEQQGGEEETKCEGSNLIIKKIAPAKKIPYVPHAYQLSLDRKTIRRNERLNTFHEWLKVQTLAGFVTRQETVSMIPPVVLGAQPDNAILDMCAAPGSKTSQLLEIVSMPTEESDKEPRGCVVANDSDPKRAYMLVHQLKRIQSPVVFITSCDAQFFPLLKNNQTTTTSKDHDDDASGGEGLFDRVLCDVPCSGDGTTRKNGSIWKHWNQHGALSLHPLQLSIALNGARLTKVGGYICYSTCSMNPVENEAVVAELLRTTDGSLELVDKRPDMDGLLARPGWNTWKVLKDDRSRKEIKNKRKKNNAKMQQRKKEWEARHEQKKDEEQEDGKQEDSSSKGKDETMDDVDSKEKKGEDENVSTSPKDQEEEEEEPKKEERKDFGPPPSWDEETLRARAETLGFTEFKSFDDVPEELRGRVRPSLFPPSEEDAAKMGLEKCLRCLPHDMDTGGFFVALFKKVKPLSAKARKKAMDLAQENRPVTDVGSTTKKNKNTGNDEKENDEPDVKKAKTEETVTADQAEAVASTNEDVAMEGVNENESKADSDVLGNTPNAEDDDMDTSANGKEEDTTASTTEKVVKGKELFRGRGKSRGDLGNEDFVPVDDDTWAPLVEFYGLSDSFPREQFMARANGEAKVLYFIGKSVKNLIDRGIQDRLTVINSGLKAFQRAKQAGCEVKYRITQEAAHFTSQYMTKRKLTAKLDDFENCMAAGGISFDNFSADFAAAMKEITVGSFIVNCEGFEEDVFHKMTLVMWRCRGEAVNCLVAKIEMDGMRSKIRALKRVKEEKKE